MSVIGRMDKQVEEVLIAPIARRHEQAAREREKKNKAQPEEESSQTPTEKEQQRDSE